MINVTLTFSGLPELLKFFASVDAPATDIKVETLLGGAPAPKPVKAAKAAPEPVVAPTPVTAPPVEAPAQVDAPAAVDYPALQKAVFALAGKSRDAAAAVAASFGVKTFKELPDHEWASALEAVTERLAIVEAN